MNVTKENFAQALESFRNLMPSASFVAVDLEMTGISMGDLSVQQKNQRPDDTPEELYLRMKLVAETFRIIQFGVCLAHPDPNKEGALILTPFNFYVFPETGRVQLECGAVSFNTQHGMNWNRWIRDGVPYVTAEQEVHMRQVAALDQDSNTVSLKSSGRRRTIAGASESVDIAFLQQAKTVMARMCTCIEHGDHWRINTVATPTYAQCQALVRWFESEPTTTFFPAKKEDLTLRWVSATSSSVVSSDIDDGDRSVDSTAKYVELVCRSAEERKEISDRAIKLKAEQAAHALDARLGCRLIWNEIVRATSRDTDDGPKVIIHNGMFDLMFLWTHFESAELPATLAEFKRQLSLKFAGGVCDTKTVSSQMYSLFDGHTSLESTFRTVSKLQPLPVTIKINAPSSCKYATNSSAHEAAFDAYLTAFVYSQLVTYDPVTVARFNDSVFIYNHPLVFRFASGMQRGHVLPDELISRGYTVWRLSGFPSTWEDADVHKYLSCEHCIDDRVDTATLKIQWIDARSVYVYVPSDASISMFPKSDNGSVDANNTVSLELFRSAV